MISFFRSNRRGLVGFILVGLCALPMLPFGADYINQASSPSYIARISGQGISTREISAKTYFSELQRVDSMIRAQFGEQYDMFAGMINIKQRVLDDLLDRELLDILADSLGLAVGTRHVEQYASTLPIFSAGVSRRNFEDFLKSQGMSEAEFEGKVRDQIMEEQVNSLFDVASVLPEEEYKKRYSLTKANIEISYAEVKPDAASISQPTSEEVRSYYDANIKQFYTSPATYPLVVRFPVSSFSDRVSVHDEEVVDAYRARIKEFTVPGRARLQRVWFQKSDSELDSILDPSSEAAGIDRNVETIKTLAQFVRSEVEKSPDQIGEIARKNGANYAEDSEMQLLDSMDAAQRDAVNSLSVGDISSVIETDDMFQIVRLLESQPSHVKPLSEVRAGLESDIKRQVAPEFARIAAEDFLANILKVGSDKQEDELRRLVDVAKSGESSIEFVESSIPLKLEDGAGIVPASALSDVMSMPQGAIRLFEDGETPILVFIRNVDEAKPKSFEEVEASIVEILQKTAMENKANTMAEEIINKLRTSFSSDSSISKTLAREIEDSYKLEFKTASAIGPESVDMSFLSNPADKQIFVAELMTDGFLGKPYKSSEGKVYIAILSDMSLAAANIGEPAGSAGGSNPGEMPLDAFISSEKIRVKGALRSMLLGRLKSELVIDVNQEYLR